MEQLEDLKGDLDLNILPGTALAIQAREPFREEPSALAIGFHPRDRKLMALGRERDGEWTVFGLNAPDFTADFDPRPLGRSSVLFTLGLYPPTVGDAFCLDSTNRLVHVPSGLSVLRPLRRYAYADQTLVYMSSHRVDVSSALHGLHGVDVPYPSFEHRFLEGGYP
jgi:hypothetical protein